MSDPASPLPRGRHGLSRDEVRSSQETRIQAAMLGSVAERGYAATTVPAVVTAAHVSRSAFYELYKDKQECFLATLDATGQELLATIQAPFVPGDWRAGLALGMEAYLRFWQERPTFARAFFLGLPEMGDPGIEYRERSFEPFRQMFTALGAVARRGRQPLSPLVPRMLVVGITELVAEEIRANRGNRLDALAPDLTTIVVRLLD